MITKKETVDKLKEKYGHAIVNEVELFDHATLEVKKDDLKNILQELKSQFEVLMDLTGVDYLEPIKRTKLVYHLFDLNSHERITITAYAERDEVMPSVTNLWRGADWYERELYDFYGVRFEGHPDLKRILMPDDWIGHPLRRDYALTEEAVQFKHGVQPKIPSEIIPYDKTDIKKKNL